MKKISILGLGYIGLPTALTLSDAGFEVCGIDISNKIIDGLKDGQLNISEPGLQELLDKAIKEDKLTFSTSIVPADVYYIAVPTPFYTDGSDDAKHADLSYVKNAAHMISGVLKPGDLVILESTVPPRTTQMLCDMLCSESGLGSDDINVVHCPERVIPGNTLYELKNNDRIIGGRTPKAADMAKAIYDKILDHGICRLTDDITAEMCKLTENTYRDVNIAFANELSIICDKMGINAFELISLANCHPRVNVLSPGVGVGGHCIAVDPWFIYEQFPEESQVILTSRLRNHNKPKFVANKVFNMGMDKNKKNPTVCVLGLSYKPDVDDLRESPSIELCKILERMGAQVIAVEPFCKEQRVGDICNMNLEDAIDKCDVSVLTIGHSQFKKNIDMILKKPCYDCVGIVPR